MRLWLAADVPNVRKATSLLHQVGDDLFGVKAHRLTDAAAKERFGILRREGAQNLLKDFKGHDTPDTVAGRAEEFMTCGVNFVTVHATGGLKMMKDTVNTGVGVYAVVFLTSLSEKEFARYYQPNAVPNMIEDAMEAGVTGFI